MGHILIKDLGKYYMNRRVYQRGVHDPYRIGDWMHILDIPQLEFQEGEMVCFLGPSGCGKY